MTKFVSVMAIFSLLPMTMASAAPISPCAAKAISHEKWTDVSRPTLDCITGRREFKESIAGLCDSSRKNPSTAFKKYLEYEMKTQNALDAYKNSTSEDGKRALLMQFNNLKRDWMIYGYQTEVEFLLTGLSDAKNACLFE